jgi:ubiquinone/menaquinone biosynthesis C-methylase UbiE
MDDLENGKYWEDNAEVWATLSRAGYDVYRDFLNTPAFFELLPDVTGLTGLDLGCGEGHNTRLLSQRAGQVYAIDVSPTFLRYAHSAERERSGPIRYAAASGQQLPFGDAAFDFVTAFMTLMDMPCPELVLKEISRVLKPRGFLQFSISHPCFLSPPSRKLLRDESENVYAVAVGRYFEGGKPWIEEWLFTAAPKEVKAGLRPFRIPVFHQPISAWFNAIVDAGFRIERVAEPFANEEMIAKCPALADTRVAAYFLHLRCRKE